MRIILLVLISIGNSLASSVIEKIDKALSDIPTTLNKRELLANYEILHAHDDEVKEHLQLSPQQEIELHRLEAEGVKLAHAYYDNHTIYQINRQSHIGEILYQDDIILTTQQAEMLAHDAEAMESGRDKRQAMNFEYYDNKWPDGVLYYSFAAGTDYRTRDIVRKGAELWMHDTCVILIESMTADQRVEISPYEPACSSFVGWVKQGIQRLKFGEQCHLIGTAAHEFGHALGLYHTHSRHDRDQYLLINIHNVIPGAEKNFEKESEKTNNNFGIPFDYGSVMMYGARSGVKYSLQQDMAAFTMMPRDMNFLDTMGSTHVAFYDVLMLNKMYDCLHLCDGKQYSPTQDRLKRQTRTRTVRIITTNNNGVTNTQTFTSGDDSDFGSDFPGFGRDGGFFSGINGIRGFNFDGMNFGGLEDIFQGFNIPGSNGNGGFWGHNGGNLRGEEGGRNSDGGLPGEEGGRNPSNPPRTEGGMNPSDLPGDEGSNTGGRSAWWNLPGIMGGMLPDWIWNIGANWDWDFTVMPTTTTTTRPIITKRPKPVTKPPSRITSTTTPSPIVPPGPGPTYSTAKCTNGGYPSPRDCSRCVCPRGYGGRYCNERPAGPGKTLEASTQWKTIETKVGWPNVHRTSDTDDFVWEYYWIKAPQGRKIEVKIKDLYEKMGTEGCYWAAIEIKYQKDQRLTGVRVCSETFIGRTFKSETSLVPIIMYSKMWPVEMAIQYRLI